MTLEHVEPVRPVAPVRRQPAIDLSQRCRIKAVPAPLRVDADAHEPGLAQHPQMLGDAGLAQPELVDQLAYRVLALAQQVEESAAGCASVSTSKTAGTSASMTARAYSARR